MEWPLDCFWIGLEVEFPAGLLRPVNNQITFYPCPKMNKPSCSDTGKTLLSFWCVTTCTGETLFSNNGRRGSSILVGVVAQWKRTRLVLQSRVRIRRLPSPQLTANLLVGCHLGMGLGCVLTSVRGNRGENYENEPLVPKKHTKKKNYFQII